MTSPQSGATTPRPTPTERGSGVERRPGIERSPGIERAPGSPRILRTRPETAGAPTVPGVNGVPSNGAPSNGSRPDIEAVPRPKTPTRGYVPNTTTIKHPVDDDQVEHEGPRHPRNNPRYGYPHGGGYGYGHGYGYRHDVYLDYYGSHSYRYLDRYPYRTYNYRSYRYCNGYYGDPYYYGAPFGHYGYTRLGLYFGFLGYYRYDPYYGHYDEPIVVEVDDGRAEGRNVGALDLNVRPKDAEVYLNGHYVGTTGNYDGYPQFLWLEEGEYEVILFKEGYKTERRIYDVRAGLQIDVEMRMEEGVAEAPETLSHRDVAPESFAPADDTTDTAGYEAADAASIATAGVSAAPASGNGGPGVIDAREAPAQVRVAVTPTDASIYVDGRFVGTGTQLGGAFGALLLEAGKHTVEIVHPAYETRTLDFEVTSGETLELEVPALEARL